MPGRATAAIVGAAVLALVGCDEGGLQSPTPSYGVPPGGGTGGTPPGPPINDGCAIGIAPGGFCVYGNRIYDGFGNVVVFRGVNRPSLEWNAAGEAISQADFQAMVSWGANVVRIPLNQTYWLDNTSGHRATVETAVAWARATGLAVILDLHWSTAGGTAQPEQQDMPDQDSVVFWQQIATQYQHDGGVIFDLYNEPRNVRWDDWYAGGVHDAGWTMIGMQQLYDTVRATGAQNLVLVGGLDWAYTLSGVSTRRIIGHNVAYATHLYPYESKLSLTWYEDWFFLAEYEPIVVTEFGPDAPGIYDLNYPWEVIGFADQNGIGWVAWAWYPFSTNGFFTQWNPSAGSYPITEYGALIQNAL